MKIITQDEFNSINSKSKIDIQKEVVRIESLILEFAKKASEQKANSFQVDLKDLKVNNVFIDYRIVTKLKNELNDRNITVKSIMFDYQSKNKKTMRRINALAISLV